MKTLNVTEAKAKFSQVVEQASNGESIIVTRMGRPIVKITRYEPAMVQKRTGHFNGQITIHGDFDEWPEEESRALGIID